MSAAQEIKDAAHPSLMSYSTALHGESVPIVPGMKGKGGGPGGMGMPPGGPGFGYGGPPPGYTASYGANLGNGHAPRRPGLRLRRSPARVHGELRRKPREWACPPAARASATAVPRQGTRRATAQTSG